MSRIIVLIALAILASINSAWAQEAQNIGLTINTLNQPIEFSSSVNLLIAISSISIMPFLLISTTAFVRFAIVLGMLRQALGLNTSPPNQVIIALAMFLTVYVMSPTWTTVYETAIQPYNNQEITQDVAIKNGIQPFKDFMLKYTREKDLALFIEFSRIPPITNIQEVPMFVLIPAFLISELKTAFQIGFLIYIPFLVIDMVVASVLLSMGMMMLPPVMIALPFKIIFFVLVDGWYLVAGSLIQSF